MRDPKRIAVWVRASLRNVIVMLSLMKSAGAGRPKLVGDFQALTSAVKMRLSAAVEGSGISHDELERMVNVFQDDRFVCTCRSHRRVR